MASRARVVGQVGAAVGATLAAGGIASFFWPKVELRLLGDVLTSERSRLVWGPGWSSDTQLWRCPGCGRMAGEGLDPWPIGGPGCRADQGARE